MYSLTGYLYGAHCLTSSMTYSAETLRRYDQSVARGLRVLGIDRAELGLKTVLDVGTGNYGLAFARAGAKQVRHIDLNWMAVERSSEVAQRDGLNNYTSYVGDLHTVEIPDGLDIIYFSGILQHLRQPHVVLSRLCSKLNSGGLVYLDHYRSGRYRWFIASFLRRLRMYSDFADLKILASFMFFNGAWRGEDMAPGQPTFEDFVDDVFVENIHLFHPADVTAAAREAALDLTYGPTSKNEPDAGDVADHSISVDHIFNTIVLRKLQSGDVSFRPMVSIDQLSISYESETIRKTVAMMLEALGANDLGFMPRMKRIALMIAMHRTACPLYPNDLYHCDAHEKPGPGLLGRRHALLQKLLTDALVGTR
jgi:hypothetical protein